MRIVKNDNPKEISMALCGALFDGDNHKRS